MSVPGTKVKSRPSVIIWLSQGPREIWSSAVSSPADCVHTPIARSVRLLTIVHFHLLSHRTVPAAQVGRTTAEAHDSHPWRSGDPRHSRRHSLARRRIRLCLNRHRPKRPSRPLGDRPCADRPVRHLPPLRHPRPLLLQISQAHDSVPLGAAPRWHSLHAPTSPRHLGLRPHWRLAEASAPTVRILARRCRVDGPQHLSEAGDLPFGLSHCRWHQALGRAHCVGACARARSGNEARKLSLSFLFIRPSGSP